MRDGLYRVTTAYLCAGYVVEWGQVTLCAPILRQKLPYWQSVAERVPETAQDAPGTTNALDPVVEATRLANRS